MEEIMEKIFKIRKKKTRVVILITMFIAIIMGTIIGFNGFEQVYRLVKFKNAPTVQTRDEISVGLENGGAIKLNVPYLDYGGYTYGTEKNTEYILSYSEIEDAFILIVQQSNEDDQVQFEENRYITLTSNTNNDVNAVLDEFIQDIADGFEVEYEAAESIVYPQVLYLEAFTPKLAQKTYIGLGIMGLGIVISIFIYLKSINDMKKLDPTTMEQLDQEIVNPIYETKAYLLTQNYLINITSNKIRKQFIKLDDICWIYLKRVKHSYNFVPTGTTFQLVIHTQDHKQTEITMTSDAVDEAINQIATLRPQIVVGYHDDIAKAWRKATDLADLRNKLQLDKHEEVVSETTIDTPENKG